MNKFLLLMIPVLLVGCAHKPEVEKHVDWKCGDQVVSVQAFNGDSMVLRINGVNNLLIQTIAASGAKYENEATGVIFWNKGDENTLIIRDRVYPQCEKV